MAIYPGATVQLLDRKYAGYNALVAHNRMNLHVAVSLASTLFGYFNRAYRPSSHMYVLKNGRAIQYVDSSRAAEADLEGNNATFSVETQGGLFNAQSEPWTPEQCETLADMYAWYHKTHGTPLRLATDSKLGASSKGLSWHRLGIDGNFPGLPNMLAGRLQRGGGMHYSTSRGKVCPGDAKIQQIPGILARAAAIAGGAIPVENPVTPTPLPEPTPVPLSVGFNTSGHSTAEVQTALNRFGHNLSVDGVYGVKTTTAVRHFQDDKGLVVDGIAGVNTWGKLSSTPVPVTRRAPRKLTVDGIWGVLTTKKEQKALRVTADGVRGPITIAAEQRRTGARVDGLDGPDTRKHLQAYLRVNQDSIIGPITVKALQTRLNAGTF